VTTSIRTKLALTSPTGGGCSVGIVRSRLGPRFPPTMINMADVITEIYVMTHISGTSCVASLLLNVCL
jgi:hypothetical protein